MAKSTSYRRTAGNSRSQRDQRISAIGTVVFVVVSAAVSAWLYYRSDPSDGDATSLPNASVPPMPVWLIETKQSINDLVNARNNIAAAAARRDLAATGVACRNATGAVANLHQQMPSPEPSVNNPLQQAITSYEMGLPYCISASQIQDGAGLQRAATLITQGDAAMRQALDLLGDDPSAAPCQLGVLIV